MTADVTPHLAEAVGLAARVQGLFRYYALELVGRHSARLVRCHRTVDVLGEVPMTWDFGQTYQLTLGVVGNHLRASVDGQVLFEVEDTDGDLDSGGVALMVTDGRTATETVRVRPCGPGLDPVRPQNSGQPDVHEETTT